MYDISRYECAGVVGEQQGTRRYVFDCTRFMHVLVTHHLHGGDAMEGRAPDAERAFRHNATAVQPLLYASVRG